jgi:type IV pilus assembly protein PilO
MHPAIENFLERPTKQLVGAWILALLVVFGLGFQYFISPLLTEQSDLNAKIVKLEGQIFEQRRKVGSLPKFKKQLEQLESKLKVALDELPDKRQIPELLQTVSSLARDVGLKVTQFQPMPELLRDFYAEVPVALTVEGSYHQIATFFDEVGTMDRIVNVGEIDIWNDFFRVNRQVLGNVETMDSFPVRAKCVATTFRYLDDEERAGVQAIQEKQPTGRRGK